MPDTLMGGDLKNSIYLFNQIIIIKFRKFLKKIKI